MAANVETMFSVREKPWHGLGTIINEAPISGDALRLAGLDWQVYQQDLVTDTGIEVSGYKANIHDGDNSVLGVVVDRYKLAHGGSRDIMLIVNKEAQQKQDKDRQLRHYSEARGTR